jgi:hypothetical protein
MSIPTLAGSGNIEQWAFELVKYLKDQEDTGGQINTPRPVQLAHTIGDGNIGLERATTEGILMFDPIENMLMISVQGTWQYIFDANTVASLFSIATYGQMAASTPTAGNDPIPLTGLWENVTVFDTIASFNRGITFTLGAGVGLADVFVFDYSGIYRVTLGGTIDHDQFPSDSRAFSVRLFNITEATGTPPATYTIARNAGTTSFSLTFLSEITEAQIGDQFTVQVGNADAAIIDVVWDRTVLLMNMVSEWKGPAFGPTGFLGPSGFRKTHLSNIIVRP